MVIRRCILAEPAQNDENGENYHYLPLHVRLPLLKYMYHNHYY